MAKMTSSVKFVQKIIDAIYKIEAPKWFVNLMAEVQEAVILAFYQFSKDELEALKAKMIEVSKKDIDGDDKFKEVFDFCKTEFKDKKDRVLNAVINAIYLTIYKKF
ncbi:MAG: hypothetical protein WC481_08515 [Candidatus Omnitrophota bacterium]